ncbi:hypothetical protein CHARACLAT_022166, partial [Characodon lateralis]|nr:hypothetical protein [Characodon lateralis]
LCVDPLEAGHDRKMNDVSYEHLPNALHPSRPTCKVNKMSGRLKSALHLPRSPQTGQE